MTSKVYNITFMIYETIMYHCMQMYLQCHYDSYIKKQWVNNGNNGTLAFKDIFFWKYMNSYEKLYNYFISLDDVDINTLTKSYNVCEAHLYLLNNA